MDVLKWIRPHYATFLKQSRLVQVHMRETSDLNDDEDVVGDDDDVTWRGGWERAGCGSSAAKWQFDENLMRAGTNFFRLFISHWRPWSFRQIYFQCFPGQDWNWAWMSTVHVLVRFWDIIIEKNRIMTGSRSRFGLDLEYSWVGAG